MYVQIVSYCVYVFLYLYVYIAKTFEYMLSTDILITVLLWMKLFAQEIVTECCYKRQGIHFIQEFNGLRV